MSSDMAAAAVPGPDSVVSNVLLLRDQLSCIPLGDFLDPGDPVVLLSPVVVPCRESSDDTGDPFEPFGQALAKKHYEVIHVPYTAQNGLTNLHYNFIRRARAVIFIISGSPVAGQPSQIKMAQAASEMDANGPQIVVACQDVHSLGIVDTTIPTIIQIPGYSKRNLEEAAAVLCGDIPPRTVQVDVASHPASATKQWDVQALPDSLDTFDLTPVVDLWNRCLPKKYHLHRVGLQSVLSRDGYSKHFVVRAPETGRFIGFCATYTTWAFSDPEYLVGSLAAIIVDPGYQNLGVGRSLHDYAKDQLLRTRGVKRLQIGSTFPRLFYGVPDDSNAHAWLVRRGWNVAPQTPGCGRIMGDWILQIEDWPGGSFSRAPEGFTFRQCNPEEIPAVLQFVGNEALRNEMMGSYEIYKWSRDFASDIILGLHGSIIVASALIYTANSGSQAESDIPWPRAIGPYVGGITCICIAEENSVLMKYRDSVMFRLLGSCVQMLQSLGMQSVFLDAIHGGDEGFKNLGFQQWARYRELWQKV